MIHPATALGVAGALILVSLALFWPKGGLYSRWRFLMWQSQRSYLEDALKHIYECEHSRIACTMSSLAGSLFLRKNRVIRLAEQLKSSGMIHIERNTFHLTDKGREHALRMLRLHRIWESYLASETGLSELDWHSMADRDEHRLEEQEIEKISERLGHPRYDPHGEPIPTDTGELPPERGILLTELGEDTIGKIIQFEDDPEDIYREIRKSGLTLGMQIDSVRPVNGVVRFNANGSAKKLPLIAAAQIRVEVLDADEIRHHPLATLLDLKSGEAGQVVQLSRAIRGSQRRRLLDLGVVPGTIIRKEFASASGNPVAFNIKGALIALRKNQAQLIHIEKIKE